MDVLVTDANIWIDLEVGELLEPFFELPHDVVVPDALFHDELAEQHGDLVDYGLGLETVTGSNVARVVDWQSDYPNASRNDLLALSLADQVDGILVSGDGALRNAADSEDVEVHGTIWVADQLLAHDLADKSELRTAFQAMKDGDRRLPWNVIDDRLNGWGLTALT